MEDLLLIVDIWYMFILYHNLGKLTNCSYFGQATSTYYNSICGRLVTDYCSVLVGVVSPGRSIHSIHFHSPYWVWRWDCFSPISRFRKWEDELGPCWTHGGNQSSPLRPRSVWLEHGDRAHAPCRCGHWNDMFFFGSPVLAWFDLDGDNDDGVNSKYNQNI